MEIRHTIARIISKLGVPGVYWDRYAYCYLNLAYFNTNYTLSEGKIFLRHKLNINSNKFY